MALKSLPHPSPALFFVTLQGLGSGVLLFHPSYAPVYFVIWLLIRLGQWNNCREIKTYEEERKQNTSFSSSVSLIVFSALAISFMAPPAMRWLTPRPPYPLVLSLVTPPVVNIWVAWPSPVSYSTFLSLVCPISCINFPPFKNHVLFPWFNSNSQERNRITLGLANSWDWVQFFIIVFIMG